MLCALGSPCWPARCVLYFVILKSYRILPSLLLSHITMTSYWPRWRLKSPASRLFTQSYIQTGIKENFKAPRHWLLCGEFTGDRWIPRTNGQLRGKCFHLMTSLWHPISWETWQSSWRYPGSVKRHEVWTNPLDPSRWLNCMFNVSLSENSRVENHVACVTSYVEFVIRW